MKTFTYKTSFNPIITACPYSEFFWFVFSRIWSECGREKTLNTNTFHAVHLRHHYHHHDYHRQPKASLFCLKFDFHIVNPKKAGLFEGSFSWGESV